MQVAKKPRRAYIIDSDSDWVLKFTCLVLVLTIIHHLPIWKYQEFSLTTQKDVKCPKIASGHLVITWGHVWLIGNHEFSSNLGIIALTTGKIALAIARAITLPVVQLFPNWRIRDYLYLLFVNHVLQAYQLSRIFNSSLKSSQISWSNPRMIRCCR